MARLAYIGPTQSGATGLYRANARGKVAQLAYIGPINIAQTGPQKGQLTVHRYIL